MLHVVNYVQKRCLKMIDYYSVTDKGLHRLNNQDSYLTITNESGDFLALVCDGIGGAKAGDVASKESVNYLEKVFKTSGPFNSLKHAKNYIENELINANKHVFNLANSNIDYYGMGTTVTGILVTSFGILTINAGDSRTYGLKDKKLIRLTNDHTLVNQMIENGEITYEESLTHPKKHYLVRAVGVWDNIEFDINEVDKMDYFMICSDGLCGYVSDEEIDYVMDSLEFDTCKKKAIALKDLALNKGGFDNITVIVVKL